LIFIIHLQDLIKLNYIINKFFNALLALLHEGHADILKTNIADILSDSEFRGFNIGNYTKKLKAEFTYKPNEEVLSEYSLDPFLHDLHNYYSNNNSNEKGSGCAKAFNLDIDSNEIFSSINRAFMRRKYNENDIIINANNNNSNELKQNLLISNFIKEKSENEDFIFKDNKNTLKNFLNTNSENEKENKNNKNNNLLNEIEIKPNKSSNNGSEDANNNQYFLEYFIDKEEEEQDLNKQPKKETLEAEKYIGFRDPEKEIFDFNNVIDKKKKKAEEKFLFNNEFKRIYSEMDSEKADFYLDKRKINSNNSHKQDFENFLFAKASEVNLMRKDSQLSNAASEKIVINIGSEDADYYNNNNFNIQINSNENSNNFQSENFKNANNNNINNYLEDIMKNNKNLSMNLNEKMENNINNNGKMDIDSNQDFRFGKIAKSQSGLFDCGKYAKFESLFSYQKNSSEFDLYALEKNNAKKSNLDLSAEKNSLNDCIIIFSLINTTKKLKFNH